MATNRAEPGDIETLNIKTKYGHGRNHQKKVTVAVAPMEPEVALLLVAHLNERRSNVIQACLSLEEIEMVIGGLTLAKFRMEILQMKDGPEKMLIAEITKEWSLDDWDATQHNVGDLRYDISEWIRDQPIDCDLSTEAGILEAKFHFEQYMGW